MVRTSLVLPNTLHQRLLISAKQENKPISRLIREVLEKALAVGLFIDSAQIPTLRIQFIRSSERSLPLFDAAIGPSVQVGVWLGGR
jgi:hypothetical protein